MAERWIVAVPRGPDLVQGIEPTASVAAAIRLHIAGQAGTPATHELTFGDARWVLLSTIPPGLRLNANPYWQLIDDPLLIGHESDSVQTRQTWDAAGALARDVLPKLRRAFHLPADRAGLMNVYGTLVSALIDHAATAEPHRAVAVPPLSSMGGDFLAQLLERWNSLVANAPDATGSLSAASRSASKRRSSVEPSRSGACPASRIRTSPTIAEIVRAGVRVILTTHSEWVLEELGNVVGRAELANRSEREAGAEPLPATSGCGCWTDRGRQRIDSEGDRTGRRYGSLPVRIRHCRGRAAQRLGEDRRPARGYGVTLIRGFPGRIYLRQDYACFGNTDRGLFHVDGQQG